MSDDTAEGVPLGGGKPSAVVTGAEVPIKRDTSNQVAGPGTIYFSENKDFETVHGEGQSVVTPHQQATSFAQKARDRGFDVSPDDNYIFWK